MKNHRKTPFWPAVLAAGIGLIFASQVTAQTFAPLYSFTGLTDGGGPSAPLIVSGNTLYGTAAQGGSNFSGSVFSLGTNGGNFGDVYDFSGPDGDSPNGALVLAGNTLYGTTFDGGAGGFGTVFAVNTDGTGFTNLYSFTNGSDGADLDAGLVLAGNTLFGTASDGGTGSDGTIFAVNTDGTGFTTLHSFAGTDGASPQCTLVLSGSTLYGTASQGGTSGNGTIFKISTNGTGFATVYNFTASAVSPIAGLILSGTSLYGTAYQGGSGYGTIYKVSTTGTGFTNLYNFTGGSDGSYPFAGLYLSGSTLYGTASQGGGADFGTIFTVGTSGTGFSSLYSFVDGSDGAYPDGGVILVGSTLYGTAAGDGISDYGSVFKVALGSGGTGFQLTYTLTTNVDISINKGNETDPTVAVNPNNPTNLFVAGVCSAITNGGLLTSYTSNLTAWTTNIVAAGGNTNGLPPAGGQPTVAWDINSNLYLAYVPASNLGIAVAISTNGGKTFSSLTNLVTNDVTQYPRITAGAAGSAVSNVWLVYKDYTLTGTPLVAQGLQITNMVANVASPVPTGTNVVTDLIGTNSIALAVLGTKVATITSNQMVIGASAPIILTTNTLVVSQNGSNVATYTFNTNPGYVTTITPSTNGPNPTNCITNYAFRTTAIGSFSSAEIIPASSNGGFPDIAVGPNNQAMVAYQNNINSAATSQVFVSLNPNVTVTNGFGSSVAVTSNAIGGLTYIPAEPSANGVNAGVGLAWDQNPNSLYYGRAYLTYTSAQAGKPNAINVDFRYTVNNGATWSTEAQINDDTNSTYSHFLPRIAVDPATGSVALSWYDCRNDTGASANEVFTITSSTATNIYTNFFDLDNKANDDFMVYSTASLTGGAVFAPNIPMLPIWTLAALKKALPTQTAFTYVSEAAKANNPNGLGHHIAMAYSAGNAYTVWADNSDFALPANPDFPTATNFDFYMGYSVLQTANLGIFVTVSPTNPISGESITYSVVVTNYGPFPANDIIITNVLADNVTLVGQPIPAPTGTYSVSPNGQVITFNYLSLPLAPKSSITNSFIISETQSGYATNIASVGSSLPSPNPANNVVTNIVLVGSEDLAIGITASPTNVNIGGLVTYTMSVTNLGPAANGPVFVTNTLSGNLTQLTNVLQDEGTYTVSNRTIIFNLGLITNQGVVNMSYSAMALSSTSLIATNTATVDSTDFDTNTVNNTAVATVTILGEDLGVTMTATPTNVNIGDTITYTIDVTNSGPSSTGVLMLTNVLSSNLGQINLIQLPPGFGSVSRNVISFNMGTMAVGQDITIIYTAVALSVNASATNAISTATITSTDFDTNLVNNTATTLVTINGEDLGIGLSGSAASIAAGQLITYTESVTNFGLSTNGVISVTNVLSPNLTFNSVVQAPGNYSVNGNNVVFQIGALDVGQTASITFTVIPNTIGVATNTAIVGSTDFDTNMLNNSAQFLTTVFTPPPPITNFTVIAYASSAFIVWGTPYPATAQVSYGLTTNYGSITSLSGPATNHIVLLSGLTRDTNYYFSAVTWEQGNAYTNIGSFSTVDTLILNTIDALYSNFWTTGSGSLSGIYGSYFNDTYGSLTYPTASAIYTPTISTPGLYNVSAWYPISTNFATNAVLVVNGATNAVVDSVNQRTNGGAWFPLATNIYLTGGTNNSVIIYNSTGNTNVLVAANAMKWSYAANQDYTVGTVPAWWAAIYLGSPTADASAYYADYVFGVAPGSSPANTPNFWVNSISSNTVSVFFAPYQGGRTYQLQAATDLGNPAWLTLTNQPALDPAGTGYAIFTVTQPNASQYFFRLSAQLGTNY